MRILVTGGAGFIGSHVVEAFLAAGHDVAVADNLWLHGGGRLPHLSPQVRFYATDITTPALAEVFERERPEVVSHQAAQHSVKLSAEQPALDASVNILGLLNILENARQHGTRKVIFASSAATYGTPAPSALPIDEETPQRPESPYGITKMAAEHYLRYYRATYGLDYTVLRYSNVYGPRQDPNGEAGVIAIFAGNLLAGRPIRIDGDGEQARDYVYVEDIARANVLALRADTPGGANRLYCLGTGIPTSVNEVYRRLVRLIGCEAQATHAPRRPGDIRLIYFNSSRARTELGWMPTVALDEGLRTTVAALRTQSDRPSAAVCEPEELAG